MLNKDGLTTRTCIEEIPSLTLKRRNEYTGDRNIYSNQAANLVVPSDLEGERSVDSNTCEDDESPLMTSRPFHTNFSGAESQAPGVNVNQLQLFASESLGRRNSIVTSETKQNSQVSSSTNANEQAYKDVSKLRKNRSRVWKCRVFLRLRSQ